MNLNRQQLSLLITVFSLSIVVLLLYNIHLGGKQEEEYVIEMSLADEDIEEHKETFTNNLKYKRSSISYSLVDRNAYSLPPPIYTCIEGGKVVINIKVGRDGYVTEATFNETSSGTNNYCLIDNAITYALKARFNTGSKASQIGTITYLFQPK